jgi:hypothetical protein
MIRHTRTPSAPKAASRWFQFVCRKPKYLKKTSKPRLAATATVNAAFRERSAAPGRAMTRPQP